jgi:hypothetical protein
MPILKPDDETTRQLEHPERINPRMTDAICSVTSEHIYREAQWHSRWARNMAKKVEVST